MRKKKCFLLRPSTVKWITPKGNCLQQFLMVNKSLAAAAKYFKEKKRANNSKSTINIRVCNKKDNFFSVT